MISVRDKNVAAIVRQVLVGIQERDLRREPCRRAAISLERDQPMRSIWGKLLSKDTVRARPVCDAGEHEYYYGEHNDGATECEAEDVPSAHALILVSERYQE